MKTDYFDPEEMKKLTDKFDQYIQYWGKVDELESTKQFKTISHMMEHLSGLLQWFQSRKMLTTDRFNTIASELNQAIRGINWLVRYAGYLETENIGLSLLVDKANQLIDPGFAEYLGERFQTDMLLAVTAYQLEQRIIKQLKDLERKEKRWDAEMEVLTKKINRNHAN